MGTILDSLPTFMLVGIILVIGVSQFNRIIGGILGVVFWIVVGVVGTQAYEQGGGIGLPGYQFSREMFYGLCAVFAAFSGWNAYKSYVKRARWQPPQNDDSSN